MSESYRLQITASDILQNQRPPHKTLPPSPMTCCSGPVKEDGVGNKDQQHGRVCGDVVRDGVLEALLTPATTAPDLLGEDNEQQLLLHRSETAGGALLGDGWVVEHGHSFNAQQQSQTPGNHVVEDDGAVGERNSHETAAHSTGAPRCRGVCSAWGCVSIVGWFQRLRCGGDNELRRTLAEAGLTWFLQMFSPPGKRRRRRKRSTRKRRWKTAGSTSAAQNTDCSGAGCTVEPGFIRCSAWGLLWRSGLHVVLMHI